MWREIIARSGKVAYGKFFDKKAGFISVEWLPVFANYRRDGYDFDALYEDGKAPRKHKKIMDNFIEDKVDSDILSNQLKIVNIPVLMSMLSGDLETDWQVSRIQETSPK
ncbi:hypothetical protein [Lacrimispora saccharolytica]|uniref:AlkZ-related protein n=1 Tax=Lacrimispora saccharolytica TaxID=84030 RepID=UPI002F429F52